MGIHFYGHRSYDIIDFCQNEINACLNQKTGKKKASFSAPNFEYNNIKQMKEKRMKTYIKVRKDSEEASKTMVIIAW